jgi:hypothetical protein
MTTTRLGIHCLPAFFLSAVVTSVAWENSSPTNHTEQTGGASGGSASASSHGGASRVWDTLGSTTSHGGVASSGAVSTSGGNTAPGVSTTTGGSTCGATSSRAVTGAGLPTPSAVMSSGAGGGS